MEKPHSPSCDRNRDPILGVLRRYFADRQRAIELGSGTGQHAVYFANALPHLQWQTSDVAPNLPGIRLWLEAAALPNTPAPLQFDVDGTWPPSRYDALFTANTLHIMSWPQVERLFGGLQNLMTPHAVVAIYGPFNYHGNFTSESNAVFNQWLQSQASHMAIRDFEAIAGLASTAELKLLEDIEMPANNRMLVWRKT